MVNPGKRSLRNCTKIKMEKLKLKLCTSTSSQCNFFVREKATKHVQVKPDVRSKAVSVSLKPEVCQSCNEKVIQVHTESTVKRRVVDRGTQHNSTEVLPIAIERILYVLRTMPAYGCLQYEVLCSYSISRELLK